jgi:hypothetical protein
MKPNLPPAQITELLARLRDSDKKAAARSALLESLDPDLIPAAELPVVSHYFFEADAPFGCIEYVPWDAIPTGHDLRRLFNEADLPVIDGKKVIILGVGREGRVAVFSYSTAAARTREIAEAQQ